MKKILPFTFTLLACFVIFASPVYAETSGQCGANITWSYSGTTLTISGSGEMYDYNINTNTFAPWYDYQDSITNINFSGSIKSIGVDAFSGCTVLTSLAIPDSVTSIRAGAFCDCTSLASILIPDSVTSIDEFAFDNTPWLTTQRNQSTNSLVVINHILIDGKNSTGIVAIPKDVTSISNYAFYLCSGISTLIITDNVTTIGKDAFLACKGIVSLTLGKNVTTIGKNAFKYLTQLTAIHWNATKVNDPSISYNILEYAGNATSGITVTFGDNVETIPDYAFCCCTGLRSITFSDNITSVGNYAFSECTNLTSITFPDSVTSIGNYVCSNCTNLTSITFPDSVTSVGNYVCSNCTNLTSVIFSNNTHSIGDHAFFNCTTLTSITFPGSIISIDNYAFSNCFRLTSLVIPDNVTTIGDYSFSGLSNLISITIPVATTSIGPYTFQGRSNNLTISGYEGSYAKSYADLYGIRFSSLNYDIIYKDGSSTLTLTPSQYAYSVGLNSLPTPTKTGYSFDGWYNNAGLSGNPVTSISNTQTGTVTLYAKWKTSFTDVPTGSWYEKFVNNLVGKGILSGYKSNDGTYAFHPDNTITRAEFATILAKASGEDLSGYVNKTSFNDVDVNYWGAKFIEWAFQNHIVSGVGSGKYDPEANITRQEMAVMIYRFATAYQKENLPQKNAALTFTDNGSIASWAATAVSAMQQAGVINGIANGNGSYRFEPGGNAQRSAAATMISIYLAL